MSSSARWIWTPLREYINQHVYFRKAIEIPSSIKSAQIRLTADTRYQFFINGKPILRGPARGFPDCLPADVLDIAPHLKRGKNVIAAHVLSFGISTSQNVFRDRAGFYLEGRVELADGSDIELDTNHTWHYHDAVAYKRYVSRSATSMGFQEHFDASRDLLNPADKPGWTEAGYDDTAWPQAYVLGAVGVLPWSALKPRAIAYLQNRNKLPLEVIGQWEAPDHFSAAGDDAANPARLAAAEKKARPGKALFSKLETIAKGKESCAVKLRAVAAGRCAALMVDFGETLYGYPVLKISGAHGGEIFDLIYSEQPAFGGVDGTPCNGRSESCISDRLVCRDGANRFETLQPRGFRYLMLVARNVRHALAIEQLSVIEASYPAEQRGSFSCSDKTLTRIWDTGVRTLRHCMADTYMDNPRTQEQGWAAARIAGTASFYSMGDSALYRRGLQLMAQSLPHVPDGLLLGVVPSERPDCVLLDYCLHWIASLNEYYRFTGDKTLLEELRGTLEKVLGFFSILAGERGLIGPVPNYALFLDWAPGLDRGNLSATFNLLYVHALRHAAQIGKVLDDSGLANHCIRHANALADRIIMVFASSRCSLLFESVDMKTGEPGDLVSQHGIALSVLERVLGKRDYDRTGAVAEVLSDFLPPPGADIAMGPIRANLFFRAFVHEALASLALGKVAIDDIRRTWGYMLDQGATTWWERLPIKPNASRCHAWSVHPTTFLSRHVLGLSPADPGWTRFNVNPQSFDLSKAKGKVPTPHGEIEMSWSIDAKNCREVNLVVPAGTEAIVAGVAGQPPRFLNAGKHSWKE